MKMNQSVRKITTLAMLAAISIVLVAMVRIPMFLPFLEYDPADIPILIATFLYGPLAGFGLTVVVSILQGSTLSAASGIIGITMHIFATGGFVLVAGNIYNQKKSRKRAVAALCVGTVVVTAMMVIWNIIFTPIFMGVPRTVVIDLLVPAIIPFNLIKASVNSLITFLVYKPISIRVHAKN